FASTGNTLEVHLGRKPSGPTDTSTGHMLRVVVAVKGHKCRGAEVQGRVAASRAIEELYDRAGASVYGRISCGRVIKELDVGLQRPACEIEIRRACRRRVVEHDQPANGAITRHNA